MNRRSLVFIIFLLAISSMIFWRVNEQGPLQEDEQTWEQLIPDFTARGLETRIFESDGRLSHQIRAEGMAHFSLLGRTELNAPTYISYLSDPHHQNDATGANWQVSARQGRLYENELLVLEHDVRVLNLSEIGYVEQIDTDFLSINLQTRTMHTDKLVLIQGDRFVIQGEGMRVDLEAQQLELIKHVETIFYPRPRYHESITE